MAKTGAQPGNNNATKGRAWYNALSKELTGNKNAPKLRKLAKKLIEKAEDGEGWALREIGDRLDGKPSQSVDVTVNDITHEEALDQLCESDEPEPSTTN